MLQRTYFHLAAMRASVTNGVANSALSAVQDQILTINSSGQFILPTKMQLRAGVTGSANIQRTRINTPALRQIGLPYVAPVNSGLTIASPANVADYGDLGPMIPPADSLTLEATQGGGAAEVVFGLLWLRDGMQPIASGQSYRIRFTAAITAVAGSWVNGNITFDQTLPAGIYTVNGMDIQGTNLLAARLVFANGGYRPGCLARNALTSIKHPLFTSGDLGAYGQFDSVNTPTLDIYAEAANTAQEGYLDVVRTGDRA